MCGIVGLRLFDPELAPALGELTVPMIEVLASRGKDSTGIGIYNRDAPPGQLKYSVCAPAPGFDWPGFAAAVQAETAEPVTIRPRGRDAVLVTSLSPERVAGIAASANPPVRLFGYGTAMEIYKDTGPADEVCARYGIAQMGGYQAIGHTRMATESAVTTEHSHPFAAGPDLALVHNGSFSNYATIRRRLAASGVTFDTDNDSEVAARFIAAHLAAGAGLDDALCRVLKEFDGFFTLLVATADSFAVVRDSFACKPMVIAQTSRYVAVASEYIALADLPGIDKAEVFEPGPEEIYTWRD